MFLPIIILILLILAGVGVVIALRVGRRNKNAGPDFSWAPPPAVAAPSSAIDWPEHPDPVKSEVDDDWWPVDDGPADGLDEPTIMKMPAVVVPAKPRAVLEMPDGTEVDIADAVVVVGRNPVTTEGEVGVKAVSASVSKTHFALGWRDDKVWVQDHASTNGTVVVNEDGQRAKLAPNRRTVVKTSVSVRFGDQVATISYR